MMSGLMRTLLTLLAVAAVAAPLVVLTPAGAAQAQGISSCTQSKAVVSCLFARSDTWTSISSIKLRYWTPGGTWTSVTPTASSAVTINSVRYVQLSYSGLAADTDYVLAASYTASSNTYYTASATIHTLANLLEAPEQLNVARNDAGDEATVTWAAPDGTVTSYLIQRAELQRSSGVAVWGDETYFTTADASSTTHTDTGLDPDKTYQYQVAGVNANGTGFYSTTVRTIGAAGEVAVTVDERTFDAIPTPDHGQLPAGYDTSTGDAEMVAAVEASITQILSPTGLTWDAAKMRHFLVIFGAGTLAGLGLIGNNRLGGKLSGQSVLLAFLLFNLALWLGVLWLGFPWYWAMLPTLLTVGWGLITFGKKVTA